jgi:hypothetical protein
MSNFQEKFETGELWLRLPSQALYPATSALSALYLKYLPIDNEFYVELKNNQILNFDCFYDVVFIETPKGHIFDKIEVQDNRFVPVNQDNRFFNTKKNMMFVDYWLDEINKKIYTTVNQYNNSSVSAVQIGIFIEQFDIIRNLFNLKLFYEIDINFGENLYEQTPIIEPAKITFNGDNRNFNISFILRGPDKEFGLISTNLLKYEFLEVDQVNCFLPYASGAKADVNILYQKLLETDFYS